MGRYWTKYCSWHIGLLVHFYEVFQFSVCPKRNHEVFRRFEWMTQPNTWTYLIICYQSSGISQLFRKYTTEGALLLLSDHRVKGQSNTISDRQRVRGCSAACGSAASLACEVMSWTLSPWSHIASKLLPAMTASMLVLAIILDSCFTNNRPPLPASIKHDWFISQPGKCARFLQPLHKLFYIHY